MLRGGNEGVESSMRLFVPLYSRNGGDIEGLQLVQIKGIQKRDFFLIRNAYHQLPAK